MKKHKLKINVVTYKDESDHYLSYTCVLCGKSIFIDPSTREKLVAGDARPFSRMHNTQAWWHAFTRWQRCGM